MYYLFLLLIVFFISLQNVCAKEYNKKGGALMFSAITVFFAVVVFVFSFFASSDGGFHLTSETLYYAVLFAVSYGSATIGTIFAIRYGSLSLTSLLSSFSLLIPTFYGILVLKESAGAFLYLGLVFLLTSLVLVNLNGRESRQKNPASKSTLKWVFFVLLAFIGNGTCTVVQKMQQINQAGMYKNEFMIVALSIVCAVTLVMSLILEKDFLKSLKSGIIYGGVRGLANGIVNLLVISLALTMPASVMFPVISGGGIALTSFISMTFYREKLSAKQIAGLVLGILSVVFLNI